MQLYRDNRLLPTDLPRALHDRNSRYNVVLEAGDSIRIPPFDPTVSVTGRVAFESRVLYRPGEGLGYYIRQAGGYADGANTGRTSVVYANGERAAPSRFLLFRHAPAIRPGTTIFVPANPPNKTGFSWDTFLSRTLAVMSTMATVLIAVNQIK
jgi:protein involved in polysaccharide export with SLBB domain